FDIVLMLCFFFSSRRRHTRSDRDWSSDVCSSDLWNSFSLGHNNLQERAWKKTVYLHDGLIRLHFEQDLPVLNVVPFLFEPFRNRSEERRVGKECRSRWGPAHEQKNSLRHDSEKYQ